MLRTADDGYFFSEAQSPLQRDIQDQFLFFPPRYFVENAGKLIQVPKDFKLFEQLTKNFQ